MIYLIICLLEFTLNDSNDEVTVDMRHDDLIKMKQKCMMKQQSKESGKDLEYISKRS